jgi:hypothetical protein
MDGLPGALWTTLALVFLVQIKSLKRESLSPSSRETSPKRVFSSVFQDFTYE